MVESILNNPLASLVLLRYRPSHDEIPDPEWLTASRSLVVGTRSSYASRKVERFLTESRRCLHAFSKSVCWSFISKQCLCTIAISVRYTGKIDSGVTSNASGLVRVTNGAAVLAIVMWFTRSLLYNHWVRMRKTVHCMSKFYWSATKWQDKQSNSYFQILL